MSFSRTTPGEDSVMLTAVLQSLIPPLHPRRYVGRHRPRLVTSGFSVGADAEVAITPSPRPSDRETRTAS